MKRLLYILALLLLLSAAPALHAQGDTITANPNAKLLRRIWMVQGPAYQRLQYGNVAGALFDITGDERNEFAVWTDRWHIMSYDTAANDFRSIWSFDSGSPHPPVVGDFWGDGRRSVGIVTRRLEPPTIISHYRLHVFRADSGQLDDSAVMVWDSFIQTDPLWALFGLTFAAADLDADGADELIIASANWRRGDTSERTGQIWIYKGGPDFQVDTPAVILRDSDVNNYSYALHIGDLDNDGHLDLLTDGKYSAYPRVRVFWGNGTIPSPTVGPQGLGLLYRITLGEFDGDNRLDVAMDGLSLFLSASRKDMRSRSYVLGDADRTLYSPSGSVAIVLGSLNDSSGRTDMLATTQLSPFGYGDIMLTAFSAGMNGPDRYFDAYYSAKYGGLSEGNVVGEPTTAVGDVDGDGWSDLLSANGSYPDSRQEDGIALILAGGPYIPRDSLPPSAIRDIRGEGRAAAISVWPNPATTEVNIAWRGDLRRIPGRFEVHDLLGRRVASGDVAENAGSARWACADVPAGTYLLTISTRKGSRIASVPIVKQE